MTSEGTDGSIDVLGFRLYYRLFGSARKGTVLCLHGGPGLDHQYMLPFADLAEYGYRVVFYDQLACGASERTKDVGLFTVERAVREVEEVRAKLDLGQVHLVGSSYGGLLALEYAIEYPGNLLTLTTISGVSNMPFVISEIQRQRSELPAETQQTMERFEARGEYSDPEYQRVLMSFYRRHFCRLRTWPDELNSSLGNANPLIISTMFGPAEFAIVGGLRYWNNQSRLHRIRAPTLVISGLHDEVSPKEAKNISRRIRGSRRVLFLKSSHLAMWEERESCISVIQEFLTRHSRG